MSQKILNVVDVNLRVEESNPPILVIDANGEVSSGGWTNGQLSPYVYVMPPADGIYEFDFVADPPTGMAPQVISPISASYKWDAFPEGLKGVKVYSTTNHIVKKL